MLRLFALLVALSPFALAQAAVSRDERTQGFVPLFDGVSLKGWHQIPLGDQPGAWLVRDGLLTYERGDNWLATDATYTDFVLRLEYRAVTDTDSGIFLRSTPEGYPSFTGMELEIKGNDSGRPPGPRTTGSIYGAVTPLSNMSAPAGQWNQVEVTLNGRHLLCEWNGKRIHDVNLDDPAYAEATRGPLAGRAAAGHLGFQAHLVGAPAEFRNIRIKTLAP